MNIEQTSRWRDLAGWVGAAFFLLAFLSLLDGLIGQWREPANLIKLLPGMTAEIDGPLQEEVSGIQELTSLSDSKDLKLTFATVHKGYFLGGLLWQGQVTAGPHMPPGEFHLTVIPSRSTSPQASLGFRIIVFPDPLTLQQSYKSLIRRHLGLSPWGAAGLCVPVILLAFGIIFFLARKLDRLLAQTGKAEIYRIIKRDGGYEVHFGLGTAHGVQPGLELRVYNPRGKPVGLARVEEATPRDAIAVVLTDQELRPGFMVCR